MADPAARYLAKRGLLDRWPLSAGDTTGIQQVVVIPCLAEFPGLLRTLDDLAECSEGTLAATLVICVVNNREPGVARDEDIANNRETFAALKERREVGPLRLGVVDASSPGKELPDRDGVGLARKVGLDWGVAVLRENGRLDGPLISTDGDTRLDGGFLDAMRSYYESGPRWAAVVDYAHPLTGTEADAGILSYELFLRYHELALGYAGSPYAYPTIGSTISCTAWACVAAGGMNRRQAAEDFYFLQQLAKTGVVDRVRSTCVHPAARVSHRVPFGTGRSMQSFSPEGDEAYLLYHPESYRILRSWLKAADECETTADLVDQAARVDTRLASFLREQDFDGAWARITAQSRPEQRSKRFHEWFDAFRTLKLLHYLRDTGLPRQEMFGAINTLLAWREEPFRETPRPAWRTDLPAQRALLCHLRQCTGQVQP